MSSLVLHHTALIRFSFDLLTDVQLKPFLSLADGHTKPCGCNWWKTSKQNPMGTNSSTSVGSATGAAMLLGKALEVLWACRYKVRLCEAGMRAP